METDTSETSETETSSLKTLNIDDVSMCGSVVTVETLNDDDDEDNDDDNDSENNYDEDTDTPAAAEDSSAGVAAVTEPAGGVVAESATDPRCDNSGTDL